VGESSVTRDLNIPIADKLAIVPAGLVKDPLSKLSGESDGWR
jgi:hypothetical protein